MDAECDAVCSVAHHNNSLCHLALAAFFAASVLCFFVMLAALALPPLAPPSFPRATAAGFFVLIGSDGASPVAMSTTILASCAISLGMRERFCIP